MRIAAHTLVRAQDDAKRVNNLFEKAKENKIVIEHRSLADAELNALLLPRSTPVDQHTPSAPSAEPPAAQPSHFVVTLVDRRFLYRSRNFVDNVLSYYSLLGNYVGHYVVLVGYEPATDAFRLLDPALPASEPHLVCAKDLHAARVCHGTDEDLIIVPSDGQRPASARRVSSPRGVMEGAAPASAAA